MYEDGAKSPLLFLECTFALSLALSLSLSLVHANKSGVCVTSGSAEAENTSEATAVKFKKR